MTDNFKERIEAAEYERGKARTARDKLYPGSTEWENENAKVLQWERTILDLREQASS